MYFLDGKDANNLIYLHLSKTKSHIIMELTHIEHIGIAVNSLEKAIPYYEQILGLPCYSIEEVPDQKVRTAFFKIGQTKLELLEPTSPESAVAKFIEKKGEGVHHIAYATNDLNSTLAELKSKEVQLIDQNPRKGAEGLNIAFAHPKATASVLTEFCEDPSKK